MFKILQLLRDLNTLRVVTWVVADGAMVVRIPIDEDDEKFVRDMQALFAPKED